MLVSFELTMPNVGSWNGKWTGADNKYFVVRSLKADEMKKKQFDRLRQGERETWHHNFGDGWGANVTAEIIGHTEAKRRRRVSAGFSGYEWMIDTIIKYGRIYSFKVYEKKMIDAAESFCSGSIDPKEFLDRIRLQFPDYAKYDKKAV